MSNESRNSHARPNSEHAVKIWAKKFASSLLFSAALLFALAFLRPSYLWSACTPSSATLVYQGDDNLTFYLNGGSALASCGACWATTYTYNLSAGDLASLNPAGDNVLSAYNTDTGGFV